MKEHLDALEESYKETDLSGGSRFRTLPRPLSLLVRYAAAALVLLILLHCGGVFAMFGYYMLALQLNAIFMGVTLPLVFLLIPLRKKSPKDKVPWYDTLSALVIMAASAYIVIFSYELTTDQNLYAGPFQVVLGSLAFVLLLETTRRTLGWPMVIVVIAFMLYAKFSYLLPDFALSLREQAWNQIIPVVYLNYMTGMYGSLTTLATTIILIFVAFGIFFTEAGGGRFFVDMALNLTGRVRGGPAKVAIVASAAFGSISSSPIANVVATGSFTIPMMKKVGYHPTFAAAVETVASTGGQLAPPVMGTTAFVMANFLGISYATIASAAVIPAILYYTALYLQIDLRALKTGLRGVTGEELTKLWPALSGGWEFLIPAVALVMLLFVWRYPPALSGVYGTAVIVIVSMFRKQNRLGFDRFTDTLEKIARNMMMIAPVLGASGLIVGLLGMTGAGPVISDGLVKLSGGSMFLLLVFATAACFVSGMAVSLVVTYILLASLVAPALQTCGVPLLVSHFFIFYMGMTVMFTPPFCPAAMVASALANSPQTNTTPFTVGWTSVKLGIVAYLVPFYLVYNPVLLLRNCPTLELAVHVSTALIGVFALAIGLERYLFTSTNWLQTILALVAGCALVLPNWQVSLVGLALLAVVLFWQWTQRANSKKAAAALNEKLVQ